MATPTTTLWPREPHTATKHDILSEYLVAWFPIIAQSFDGGLTYVDAFAGPGEYDQGEEGSPLIALRQAHRAEVLAAQVPIRLIFIEKRKDRFLHLDRLVEQTYPKAKRPRSHRLQIYEGECQARLTPALNELKAWDAPMFVNLDGWGTDTPYSLVHQLGRAERPEVLITFSRGWSIRNRTRVDDPHQLDRFYGEPDTWRDLADILPTQESRKALLNYYMNRLRLAGFDYSLSFELVDASGHELLLVYATKAVRGVQRMKRAMWKADPVHGQYFRDPRDVDQLPLPILKEPDLTLLKKQLLEQVVTSGPVSLTDLKEYTLFQTLFEEPRAKRAVKELETEGKVDVEWKRTHRDTMVAPTLLSGL